MSRPPFELNLIELAKEYFDIKDDIDPVGQTVVNEAISFAATALHCYKQLAMEAQAYLESEGGMLEDEEDWSEDGVDTDDGPSAVTATELVNVVRLEHLANGTRTLGRDIATALAYLYERQDQDFDFQMLLSDLNELDEPTEPDKK